MTSPHVFMTNYDKLTKEIREAPMTWLPALCLLIVERCVTEKVFASKAAMDRVLENQIARTGTPRTKARLNKEKKL